jgi:thiamine-phosphate pyrophosphorylase
VKPFHECRLYTFVDTAYLAGRSPERLAEELCAGGADVLQLRAKGHSSAEVERLARQIKPITDRYGIGLVINDDPQVAQKVGAMAVHLGQEDFIEGGYLHAREVAGDPPTIGLGLSTHAPYQAEQALATGPDYIAIGPVYATPTKPTAPAVTLGYVAWAWKNVSIPWFAIGGVNLSNIDQVLEAGARRVCVVSAILKAPNVAEACQAFKNRLLSAP